MPSLRSPSPVLRFLREHVAAGRASFDDDDETLVDRFIRGDAEAFRALMQRHGPMVLGVCRRVVGDEHAAEDAFQATFIVLANKAGRLRRPERLGPWLHGVAYRTAVHARAAAWRRRTVERRASREEAIPPDEETALAELRGLLDEEVCRLPERYRVPFVLSYLEGLTDAEVARRLHCSRGTVATWLARARQKLRHRLERRGVGAWVIAALLDSSLGADVHACFQLQATTRAAAAFLLNRSGPAASPALVLAKGVLRMMLWNKLRIVGVALVFSTALVVTVGLGLRRADATDEPRPIQPASVPLPREPETGRIKPAPAAPAPKKQRSLAAYVKVWEAKDGKETLISRPTLLTLEGQEAVVLIGEAAVFAGGWDRVLIPKGVEVKFSPSPMGDGRVRVRLMLSYTPEVSRVEGGQRAVTTTAHALQEVDFGDPITIELHTSGNPDHRLRLTAVITEVIDRRDDIPQVPGVAGEPKRGQ